MKNFVKAVIIGAGFTLGYILMSRAVERVLDDLVRINGGSNLYDEFERLDNIAKNDL